MEYLVGIWSVLRIDIEMTTSLDVLGIEKEGGGRGGTIEKAYGVQGAHEALSFFSE